METGPGRRHIQDVVSARPVINFDRPQPLLTRRDFLRISTRNIALSPFHDVIPSKRQSTAQHKQGSKNASTATVIEKNVKHTAAAKQPLTKRVLAADNPVEKSTGEKNRISTPEHTAQNFKSKTDDTGRMTIAEHVNELRRRALWCLLALFTGGIIGYRFQETIINWLTKPLGKELFYSSPTGGFDFLIKICLFVGFLGSIPIILYNFMKFILPSLPKMKDAKIGRTFLLSIVLAGLGVLFAYKVSLPAALHFLNEFSNNHVQSLISAQEYFNFVIIYLGGFAALFQMPLILVFLNKLVRLNVRKLARNQRFVILISFIIAAILTPTPDPINQTLMAVPIILLYQLSVTFVWIANRKQARTATA